MANRIYIRGEAASIVELFEDVLDKYDIRIPYPEDEERDAEDGCLYGSTYDNLLNGIERILMAVADRIKCGDDIVNNVFSEDY